MLTEEEAAKYVGKKFYRKPGGALHFVRSYRSDQEAFWCVYVNATNQRRQGPVKEKFVIAGFEENGEAS